ncbi:hypothetical protein HL666_20070 [Bradyrhizobium sp. 83002]|uniref:hypothetical protein n=1 Tax=Bradyrhizobium aeschynomenes TaxID=2734909 RepID=UPI00155631D9|nr:hypothetical protein [Bradyrhizobium aeschynomenes]NPU13070.1 hypothetical protein [Bradyrhizobium aeschynomenes]
MPTPSVDLDVLTQQACGVRLRTSGAPGERDTIIVSAQRRGALEEALRGGLQSQVQLETLDMDACFKAMGSDYVLVSPPGSGDGVSIVIGGEPSGLSRWLAGADAVNGRVRLAPEADCAALLDQIRPMSNTAAVWVEQERGLSRCERDVEGTVHLDPNKVDGYGGTIVLKVRRS